MPSPPAACLTHGCQFRVVEALLSDALLAFDLLGFEFVEQVLPQIRIAVEMASPLQSEYRRVIVDDEPVSAERHRKDLVPIRVTTNVDIEAADRLGPLQAVGNGCEDRLFERESLLVEDRDHRLCTLTEALSLHGETYSVTVRTKSTPLIGIEDDVPRISRLAARCDFDDDGTVAPDLDPGDLVSGLFDGADRGAYVALSNRLHRY